jgi:hypothetical protein
MRYRLMATYRGAPYEAGIGPTDADVVLFAACPPPEELGFEPATGHWRKQLRMEEVQALWESRPMGTFRGDRCIVLDDLGDRLHIAYQGHDAYQAERLGYWQVDRGVYELITPRDEVSEIVEERFDYPHPATGPLPAVGRQTGTQPAVAPHTGPLPAVARQTGPQPAVGRQTGTQPAVPPHTGPLPAVGRQTGPQPAVAPHTGPLPAVARQTGPQPAVAPHTGPLPAVARQSGPQPAVARQTGPQPAVARQTGPQPAARRQTGPQRAVGRQTAPQPAVPQFPMSPPSGEPQLPLEAAARRAASARVLQSAGPQAAGPQPPGLQPAGPQVAGPTRPEAGALAEPAPPPAQRRPPARRRRSELRSQATQRIFSELASLAAIPPSAYAVGEEVDGAMCLIQTPDGFEVFNAAAGARHEVRIFDDEESAYFYLFGVLAAEAVRTGRLAPQG